MNKFKSFIIVLIAAILQNTLFSNINIMGANINIILPLVIVLSQILGQNIGAYNGLFAGFIEDLLFSNILGVHALSYFLIGYIVADKKFHIFNGKRNGAITTFIATFINILIVGVLYYIFMKESILSMLSYSIIIEAFLNSLIYLLYYKFIKKIMYIPTYRI